MAAKIIKGGGEVPARPLAQPARAPVIAQDNKKVMRKDVFSANKKALEIIEQGQAALVARQQRAVEEAEAARQQALDEQSHASRQEAVENILRAYKARGDRLAAARSECLNVVNGLMVKVTGAAMSVPKATALPIIDRQLKARRGKFAAVVVLSEEDVQRLKDHAPLAKALELAPELQLQAGETGVLQVSGGEIPLDFDTAARALCRALEVPLPEGVPESGPPGPEAAEEEPAEEPEAGSEESPSHEEGTLAPDDDDGFSPEFLEEPAGDGEESPFDGNDGSGVHEAEAPSAEDEAAFGVEAEDAEGGPPGGPEEMFEDGDDTSGTASNPVKQERSVISRNPSGSAAPLPPRRPPTGRVEGTRVESSGVALAPRGRTNAVRLEEPARPATRGHSGSEERSGSHRPPPPPRAPPVDDEDAGANTVAINRSDISAVSQGSAIRRMPTPPPAPPPARTPPPADGTRVDVRGSSPPHSNIIRKNPR